jgi:nucleoside-diphosphate-sugar epimerase
LEKVTGSRFARAIRELMPSRVVETIKQQCNSSRLPAYGSALVEPASRELPSVDPEIASLQQCQYVLPITKAREALGYAPQVTFSEGARRTAEWLRFAFGVAQD